MKPPYTLKTQFTEQQFADKTMTRPGVKRIDPVTVKIAHSERLELLM